MCAGISRGLCGSHTLDIPIETVKNRWSLGVDTMKQNSEPGGRGRRESEGGTIAGAVSA